MHSEPDQVLLTHWLSELNTWGYLTNDIVQLTGGFTGDHRFLKINGARPFKVNRAEFQVLLVVMAQNRSARDLPTVRKIEAPSSYLTGLEIVGVLQEWSKDVPAAAWNGDPNNVFNVISKLRVKLSRKGHPRLLETTDKESEGGYRLSTPPFNLIINLRSASPAP